MVRHEDVDPGRDGGGDLLRAGRAAIDRDDHPGARFGRGGDRGEGQAMTLLEATRDVWNDLDPEAFQGDREDGQPGQSVGIEVPEDEDPLAPLPRLPNAPRERGRVREKARIVECLERRREEGVEVGGSAEPAPG